MAKIKDIINAVGEALSKIINSCKCSCKSCCCESECHEKNISTSELPKPKQDIKEFSTRIV
jgi:hypothetical protein